MRCSTWVRSIRKADAAGSAEPGCRMRFASSTSAGGVKTRVCTRTIAAGAACGAARRAEVSDAGFSADAAEDLAAAGAVGSLLVSAGLSFANRDRSWRARSNALRILSTV